MSPSEFLVAPALVVFILYLLRYYRAGTGPMAFVFIDDEFRAYRRGKFVGSQVTVLFTDKRIDRFAPSEWTLPCASSRRRRRRPCWRARTSC